MRELTAHNSKPLIKLWGRSMVDWQLDRLKKGGIREAVVNTAHYAELYPSHFAEHPVEGIRVTISQEGSSISDALETKGGIVKALPLLSDGQEPFVVVSGDIVTAFDYASLEKAGDRIRKGEIVGLAGLVGAGKTELCKTIFGAYHKSGGTLTLNGKELKIKNPSDAVKNRIALVPEERRKEGVLVAETVTFNVSAACLGDFCTMSFVNDRETAQKAKEYVESLSIKTPSVKQKVAYLSGGNQQKVAVAKWLAADCDVYIFDEPTKGVDVGAKQEIFHLINQIAKDGNCVIYATCENSELLSITDRMYVMFDGRIMAELETAKTTEDEIMHYATGSEEKYAV